MHTSIWKGVSRALALRFVGVFAVVAAALALAAPALATKPAQAATEDPVVADASTTWSYVDSGTRPAEGWQTSEVVTGSDWKTGTGAFGAKKGELKSLGTLANGNDAMPKTLLTQYKEDGNDIPVYFFRTTFDVKDVDAVKAITGSVDYDDAAIVAINGQVVGEFDNVLHSDETKPVYGTDDYGGSNASDPKTGEIKFSDVSKLNLKPTGNVLSVELHNGRSSSSDIYLDVTNLTLSSTALTPEPEPGTPTGTPKNVFVNIGADETHRNFNWLSTSENDSEVQYAEVSDSFKEGDALPAEGVVTKHAVRSDDPYESNEGDPVVYNFKVDEADGFAANKTYAYRVGNDTDGWSSTYTFKTQGQGADAGFKFLIAGDPQIGAGKNDEVDAKKWDISVNQAYAQNPDASFLFSMGDQVENGSSDDTFGQYDKFAAPQALRNLTLATEAGNHDTRKTAYSGQYHMPNVSDYAVTTAGRESGDYWFTYNGVLFVSLNSNDTNLNDHQTFLNDVMAKDEAKNASWKVVSFHHAPFSVASHYSDSAIKDLRAHLTPILSQYGFDVALTGHDHYYTRTYMLDANGNPSKDAEGKYTKDDKGVPTSVTDPAEGDVLYMTADSASGSKYYALNSSLNGKYPNYSAFSWQQQNPTFIVANVTKDSFTLEMYQSEDDTTQTAAWTKIDSFTINRAKTPEPAAPSLSVPVDGSVAFGSEFDAMQDVTATAGDGTTDLTSSVKVSVSGPKGATSVDTKVAGSYAITYTVTDPATGLTTTVSRTLTVEAAPTTTKPETTKPQTTKPETTKPETTKPATTEPATKPATTLPATSEPATTEPATTEPATTEPATTEPGTTEPATTEPATTEPATTDDALTGDADGSPVSDEGDKPNKQLPQTGDQNSIVPVVAIMALAAAAIIAGVVVRMRHNS